MSRLDDAGVHRPHRNACRLSPAVGRNGRGSGRERGGLGADGCRTSHPPWSSHGRASGAPMAARAGGQDRAFETGRRQKSQPTDGKRAGQPRLMTAAHRGPRRARHIDPCASPPRASSASSPAATFAAAARHPPRRPRTSARAGDRRRSSPVAPGDGEEWSAIGPLAHARRPPGTRRPAVPAADPANKTTATCTNMHVGCLDRGAAAEGAPNATPPIRNISAPKPVSNPEPAGSPATAAGRSLSRRAGTRS